jgi:hypothetical protein
MISAKRRDAKFAGKSAGFGRFGRVSDETFIGNRSRLRQLHIGQQAVGKHPCDGGRDPGEAG